MHKLSLTLASLHRKISSWVFAIFSLLALAGLLYPHSLLGQPVTSPTLPTSGNAGMNEVVSSQPILNTLNQESLRDLNNLISNDGPPTDVSNQNNATLIQATSLNNTKEEALKHPFVNLAGQNLGLVLDQYGHQFFSDQKSALRLAKPAYQAAPRNYVVAPGDQLKIRVYGQISLNLESTIDQNGNISLPLVGSLQVAGIRLEQVGLVIKAALSRYYKGFDVAVTLDALRSIQVYVTGFARTPGSHRVDGLSTLINALFATGGPSPYGSLRKIELRRHGQTVKVLDLYKFLIQGDKSQDTFLQHEDVIHIPAIGPLVAIGGSVNSSYVFEMLANENLGNMIALAGGIDSTSHTGLISIGRVDENGKRQQIELSSKDPQFLQYVLQPGDIVRVFGRQDFRVAREQFGRYVKLEGEVIRSGIYPVLEGETLRDIVAKAGGLSRYAYLFGTELIRSSLKDKQYKAFQETLDSLEKDLQRQLLNSTRNTIGEEQRDTNSLNMQVIATQEMMRKLRKIEPRGRLVLSDIQPSDSSVQSIPEIDLENNDLIYIPAKPSSVEVVGAVLRPGSQQFALNRNVGDYLRAAGGGVNLSDTKNLYIVRANGEVITTGNQFVQIVPGDTIVIPEDINRTTWSRRFSEWSRIFYQSILGIGGWTLLKSAL